MRPALAFGGLFALTCGPVAAETSYDANYRRDLAAREDKRALTLHGCWFYADGFEERPLPATPPPLIIDTSGGYRITIDGHTITMCDPLSRNRIEHWGDPHENLNGKHVKDWGGAAGWDGTRRTVVLGDGTRVTMEASGAQGIIDYTSIYDGARNVQVENAVNRIWHESNDAGDTGTREAAQYDGETARFATDPVTGVAIYENLGNQDAAFQFVPGVRLLGESGGFANPNNVRDFFDDPRLGHT